MNSERDEMSKKEIMFKEIDIIQSIINRMASNSFLIKGWTITLIVGVLLLRVSIIQFFLPIIPIIVFWILDAYFLRMERLYRKLYDWVIKNREKEDNYTLDMRTQRFNDEIGNTLKVAFSKTLILFYGGLLILTVIYGIIAYFVPI